MVGTLPTMVSVDSVTEVLEASYCCELHMQLWRAWNRTARTFGRLHSFVRALSEIPVADPESSAIRSMNTIRGFAQS